MKTEPVNTTITNTRCKVWTSFWDGTSWRHSETRDWMNEEDALSFAAGVWSNREGKDYELTISYSRKSNGRWRNCGTKPYPPKSAAPK